jgi:hypothetical protein
MKTIYYINDHHKNKQTFDYINTILKKSHIPHFINDAHYIYVGHILFIFGFISGWIFHIITDFPPAQSCRLRG